MALAAAFVFVVMMRKRTAATRERLRREWARIWVSEIRALMETSDPHAKSGGVPRGRRLDDQTTTELESLFPRATTFAVRNFFGSIDHYERASAALVETFANRETTNLGDQIRAKDDRDHCLKVVYSTGEAAIERLLSSPLRQ